MSLFVLLHYGDLISVVTHRSHFLQHKCTLEWFVVGIWLVLSFSWSIYYNIPDSLLPFMITRKTKLMKIYLLLTGSKLYIIVEYAFYIFTKVNLTKRHSRCLFSIGGISMARDSQLELSYGVFPSKCLIIIIHFTRYRLNHHVSWLQAEGGYIDCYPILLVLILIVL